MGKTTKKESDTSGEATLATASGVAPEKETVEPEGVKDTPKKAKRTRVHRGQVCEIIRTTKDTHSGAIHDLILYKRKVTNRRSGEVDDVFVGKKLRRPGTGTVPLPREIEIEE
jgi:hypothetical protein